MQISQTGIDFIKQRENCKLTSYPDEAGKPTIGYGHLILPGENYTEITLEKAEGLLKHDLLIAEDCINKHVKVPLTQNQFDALISFVFNEGINEFRSSTLLRRLNQGNYQAAANEFARWIYAGGEKSNGLINRRDAEENLFLGLIA